MLGLPQPNAYLEDIVVLYQILTKRVLIKNTFLGNLKKVTAVINSLDE